MSKRAPPDDPRLKADPASLICISRLHTQAERGRCAPLGRCGTAQPLASADEGEGGSGILERHHLPPHPLSSCGGHGSLCKSLCSLTVQQSPR